jgi:hypothetical protein
MKPKPAEIDPCPSVRLAQGDLASVDMCSCGNLRLHMGALTLRLTPEALASLLGTLGEALATHANLRGTVSNEPRPTHAVLGGKTPRGQS